MGGPGSRRRRRRSLFQKFFGPFVLLAVVCLLPLGLLLNGRLRNALQSESEQRQREELRLLERALAARWAGSSPLLVDPVVDELAAGIAGRVTVVAPDGRVLGDSDQSGPALLAMEDPALRPEIEVALAGGQGRALRYSTFLGEDFLYQTRPLLGPDGRPVAAVRLAFSQARIRSEMDAAARYLLAALALSLLVAVGLAALVARRLSRPIELLRDSADEIGRGGLGREIRLRAADELEGLAQALNGMSRALARQREELVAEKEQLVGVLEGMVEGVLVTDAGGRIVQTNPALRQMFDLVRAPVGRTSLEAFRNPPLEEILGRALVRRERAGGVVHLSHPAERHLEVEAAPLRRDGASHGVVAVFHDVTRLKKLEAVRRDFAANVSHEIRTPVTAIRGYAETLRGGTGSADERARFAEIIMRHADRLTRLVDDLLALSSLEGAGDVLKLERVTAAEALGAVDEAFGPRAAEKGIALVVDEPDASLALRTDRHLLEQVLANLVDNALKYTEPGGRVVVSARAERDRALFEVSDTGCGIPSTDLGRVFERFFRVDRARSRKLGGTGLGLAIVKHIVLLHGGEVRVASRAGEGSRFTVELPLAGPPGRAEAPPGAEG